MHKHGVSVRYIKDRGWIAFVPVALAADQLRRIAAFAYNVQRQRYLGMPHGDTKEQFGIAIEKLKRASTAADPTQFMQQQLTEREKGVWSPFVSTEPVRDKIISLPGALQ